MRLPWKRPFSMKISLVRSPATMTPREINAGDVGLEGGGVADGAAGVFGVELDAERFDEGEVGVVAGESEDELVGDGEGARRGVEQRGLCGVG